MRHYEQKAVVTAPAIANAVGMLESLEGRKSALEGMIRDRFRRARAGECDRNVSALSASLRKVKADIAERQEKAKRRG